MPRIRDRRSLPLRLCAAFIIALLLGFSILSPASPAGAARAFAPPQGAAGVGWTRGGPRAGDVLALAASQSSPATVYAFVSADGKYYDRSPSGLFKTTDSGAHWVATGYPLTHPSQTVYELAVDPTNAAVVYAGTAYGGVFKSVDGGATWAGPYGRTTEVNSLVVDPSTTGTLYVSYAGHGVHKSTDGGLTWAPSSTGIQFYNLPALKIDPANPSVIYAAGGESGPGQFGGVYKSTNGGADWARSSGGLPYATALTLAVDPSSTATLYLGTTLGVFKSTDAGANWAASGAGLPPSSQVVSLEVRPGHPSEVLAASYGGGIYRSTDAGASWALVSPADTRFGPVVADAAGAHVYAASYGLGVFRSADGGATFAMAGEGLPFSAIRHLVVDPNDPAVVLAGAGSGVYRSTDGGESWGVAGLYHQRRPVMGLAADPGRAGTFYAAPDYVGVIKSRDGGATWAPVRDANNSNVLAFALDPSNPQTLYFSRLGGPLAKSADGGATWTPVSNLGTLSHLAVDPSNAAVVYGVSGGAVVKSVNGAGSWGGLPAFDRSGISLINGIAIPPASPHTLYVYSKGSGAPVRKSADGGATWAAASAGLPEVEPGGFEVSALVVDPVNPSLLYAACPGAAGAGGGVYRSADGGGSWSPFGAPLGAVNSLALDPSGATLYAGTDRGVYRAPTPARAVGFAAGHFAAAESGGAAVITVERADASGTLAVDYATSDGAAAAGADYAAAAGTLTFAPGETSKTFSVPVLDDTLDEHEEGVCLTLTAAGGAPVLARAVLTIEDDDAPPTLGVGGVSAPEGDFDTAEFVFRLALSAPSGKAVTANVNIVPGGTAVYGGDLFIYAGPYSVTFAPGETEKTVKALIRSDLDIEPDETFFLEVTSVANASPSAVRAVGTILNDDFAPTVSLSINDVSVVEPDPGETAEAVFTVSLSGPSAKTVLVDCFGGGGEGTEYEFAGGALTFAPGETSKAVAVRVKGDLRFETDERFEFRLQSPRNALLGDAFGTLTIVNDEPAPTISVGDVTITEGDAGEKQANFAVRLSVEVETQVSFEYAAVAGTAAQNQDYTWVGGAALIFPGLMGSGVSVPIRGDTVDEPDETFFVRISKVNGGPTIVDGEGLGTIVDDDDGNSAPTFQFTETQYAVAESGGYATITVTRKGGDLSAPASVEYSTERSNNARSASDRSDYTAAMGTLAFAPGQHTRTFRVLITDDAHAERDPQWGDEFVDLVLRNPTGGFALGNPRAALLTIIENDLTAGPQNPADASRFYVLQHYYDFLNRVPDAGGLQFWMGEIDGCGSDAGCREVKRVNVSAAFFLSIEFQETGYLAYRMHKAAYGDATSPNVEGTVPVVRLAEFLRDTQQLGQDVQVGVGEWQKQLEANKEAYALEFARRQRFAAAFPETLTAGQFVGRLDQNAGGVLSPEERAALVALLGTTPADAQKRAHALRQVAEHAELRRRETNRAFVLMQYFGYLRRDPDAAPDSDFRGWKFWLDKLEEHHGNFVSAEMVRAFISSIEYRQRFGQ